MGERKKRVPPHSIWLWWCEQCQCNKVRPCPEHMLLMNDDEVKALCFKYVRAPTKRIKPYVRWPLSRKQKQLARGTKTANRGGE